MLTVIVQASRLTQRYLWVKTADQILDSIARYCERIKDSGHSQVTPFEGGYAFALITDHGYDACRILVRRTSLERR